MAQTIQYEQSSEARDAGTLVPVVGVDGAANGTEVFDAGDRRGWVIQNLSDTAVTIHLGSDDFAAGEGVVLRPATIVEGVITEPGGDWYEERYVGVVRARHHGATGTKSLSRTAW